MPVFNNALAGAAGSGGAADFKIERSLRFNIDDSAYLNRQNSSSTTSSAKKFTLSFWVKRVDSASNRHVFFSAPSLNSWNSWTTLYFMSSGQLQLEPHISQGRITTVAKYKDYTAWSHFVISVDSTLGTAADRIKIFHNGVRQAVTGTNANPDQTFAYGLASNYQQIGFNSSSYGMNGYLAEMHFVDDQALEPTEFGVSDQDTGVWNPIKFSGTHGVNGWHLNFSNNSTKDTLGDDVAGSNDFGVLNVAVTQPTGNYTVTRSQYTTGVGDQYDPYASVDGDLTTSYADRGYNNNGLSFTGLPQATQSIRIACNIGGGTTTLNANHGSSDVRTFTQSATDTGVWKTISGTISPSSPYTLTKITGDGGNQTQSYFSLYAIEIDGVIVVDNRAGKNNDSLLDSPSNYESGTNIGGNYAVMNPLSKRAEVFTSNGNLDLSVTSGLNSWDGRKAFSSIGVTRGKWYAEMTVNTVGSVYAAICGNTESIDETQSVGWQSQGWGYYQGGIIVIQSVEYSSGIPAYTTGDIIGVALDVDNLKVKFYRNGAQVGTTAGYDITPDLTWFFAFDSYDASNVSWNFGQRPFAISSVPTGHKALCTQNFDDPLIAKGSTAFDVVVYDGSGYSDLTNPSQSITGLSFSPDFVWAKARTASYSHGVFDSVRGPNKQLRTNGTNTETNDSGNSSSLVSFDTNGFTLGPDAGAGSINYGSTNYVAWTWDAGNYNNTFASNSYDQSQVWSNLATLSGGSFAAGKGLIHGFDGTTTTSTEGDSNNEYLELPISTTISAGGVRVYAAVTSSNPLVINLYNGSNNVETVTGSNSGGQWYATSTYSGAITKIRIERTGRAFEFNAVEVNGKILTDAGLIAAGSLNSSSYLSNAVYSNSSNFTYTGTSGFSSGSGLDKLFDGRLDTSPDQVDDWNTGASAHLTWTPATAIPVTSSLRIYGRWYLASHNNQYLNRDVVTINGSSTELQDTVGNSTSNHWFDLSNYIQSNNITSITEIKGISYPNGGNRLDPAFYAIEVDGKILVDSNVTPPNVPAISAVNRANQTAGFSITNYSGNSVSGSSVAHNLGKKPDLIIVKARNRADNWLVYHSAFGGSHHSDLNLTGGFYSGASKWLKDATSNVFYMHTDPAINGNFNYVAYAWTAVEGYSAFGTYVGNESATSGPFVYTGFRPRFILQKATTSETYGSWHIYDTARDTVNAVDNELYPDSNIGEGHIPSGDLNILSNGFQMNTNFQGGWNTSGVTYVYAAFAENPFKIARAR